MDREDLYELLALVDLLRAGRARDISAAVDRLSALLGDPTQTGRISTAAVSSPNAVQLMFDRNKVALTIAKAYREPPPDLPVSHPLGGPVLAEYKDDLADLLSVVIPSGAWVPAPAYHVVTDKGNGGERDLVFQGLIDAVVGRRIIDDLEPAIRKGDGDRVFCSKGHTSSRRSLGEYERWFDEWSRYLQSVVAAARNAGFAMVFKTDVKDCFPSIDRNMARQLLAQRTGAHPTVMDLLFACLEAWLPRFHYSRGSGLPIEPHDISHLVAHCILKSVDDRFEDSFDRSYRRFVDDTIVFLSTGHDADKVREEHRQALAAVGLRPNRAKTEIESVARFTLSLHEDKFLAVEEALTAKSEQDLERIAAEYDKLNDKRQKSQWVRVARRLFSASERLQSDVMKKRAIAAVSVRQLRDRALRYLRSRPLRTADVAELRTLYDKIDERTPLPGTRIELARTLAEAPLAHNERETAALASWAAERVMTDDGRQGSGYARGMLLLIVYKHGKLAERTRILNWAHPGLLTDPYFRLFFAYVFTATRELPVTLEPLLRHGGGEDFALMVRICDDARRRRIRHLGRVLGLCRASRYGRWVIASERLPFLRIVADAAREPEAPATWRDATTRWLEGTLSPNRAPLDDAVRRILAGHLDAIRS